MQSIKGRNQNLSISPKSKNIQIMSVRGHDAVAKGRGATN